jgi:hypothetical protein
MGPFDGDFWYFCYLSFGSFLLVVVVVGVFCSFLANWIFLEWVFSSIGGWRWYFRRSVAWVFSPDLDSIVDDELDEDPERISKASSPDTPGGSQ